MTDTAPPRQLEKTLLAVTTIYRTLAAGWLAILAAVVLAADRAADRPTVVWVTLSTVLLWTLVATAIAKWRPTWVATGTFVFVELLLSSFTVVAGDAAGADDFAGGYPLVGVFTAVWAMGTTGGIVAGSVLVVTQLSLLGVVRSDMASRASLLLSYLLIAAAAIGVAGVLRSSDRRRADAEERLAAAEADRARAAAKAEVAVHLHDSVLETLALIQDDAKTPDESKRLARAQERELRAWLYQGQNESRQSGFTDGLSTMAASVGDLTGVRVETVTVGDRTLDDRLRALLAAAREATMNAAKHAGVEDIAVHGEVTEHGVSISVRDRGIGFDTNAASSGRGIPDSILARMERHDGAVSIRSELGEGTEVILTMANQQ